MVGVPLNISTLDVVFVPEADSDKTSRMKMTRVEDGSADVGYLKKKGRTFMVRRDGVGFFLQEECQA